MPTPYVKKEAEKHHISDEKSESVWEKAKNAVKRDDLSESSYWAEVMTVYKKMIGEKK